MSSSPQGVGMAGSQVGMESGLQQEELEPEEFDALLHPNVLDTLADFDFSYADLGLDAVHKQQQQQQQQQQQLQQQLPPSSPKPLAGRKRSFTQACTWDNLGPKALSEISASLLAGGGGWEALQAPPPTAAAPAGAVGVDRPGPSCSAVTTPPTLVDSAPAAAAAVAPKQEAVRLPGGGHNRRAPGGGGCGKARRGSGSGSGGEGVGKRPLNPERMERKASREKRRREEVNEKFEQLLEVLEDAEVTSGLEPPAAKEGGKAGPACINGRRVEVLSRTINILKKLLRARRESLAAAAREEGEPVSHSLGSAAVGQEGASAAAAAAAATAAVSEVSGGDSGNASLAAANAAAEATDEARVAEAAKEAAAAAAANPQAMVHHMAMPMSGHHASLMMPPGFAGMPGGPHGMPAVQHGMPGHQGQPIFIAVPMYMPQGQGMPPSSSSASESSAQAPAAADAAPSLPAVPSAPSPGTPADPAATVVAETKDAAGMNPPSKAWAMPAGMGFQQMALQMPQFVTQALSAGEGDENPTHAVCA